LGYVNGNGLGGRARYFRFDQDLAAETNALVFPAAFGPFPPGTTVATAGYLNMWAADAEITQQMDLGLWQANFGGGVRVAGLQHNTGATFNVLGAITSVRDDNMFDGLGPTLFAELRRPLGNSPFALVANLRGSLVFGQWSRRSVVDNFLAVPPPFSPTGVVLPSDLFQKTEAMMGIVEMQLGMEWKRDLRGMGNFVVDALWEGQAWSGSAAMTQSGNRDLALMGFTFGAGITR
jgi:hypothetical protein